MKPKKINYEELKQQNLKIKHNIPINTLVELENGARLFVFSLGRDCDKTPLYNLTWNFINYSEYKDWEEIKKCYQFDVIGGFSEENLKIIHTNYVNQICPFEKPEDNLF